MKALRPVASFAWALASVALCGALYTGYRRAPGLNLFALEEVRVEGAERSDPAAVTRAAGFTVGESLFGADVDRARHSVEALPWVRQARVVRQVPSVVRIEVEEWVPRYLVRLDRLYYLTAEGHVVRAPLDQGLDYAVVTGLGPADLAAESPLRAGLLELLSALDRGVLVDEPGEIHADGGTGFTLYTPAGGGTGLHLGFGEFEAKLGRLARLRRHLDRRGQSAFAVNLTYDDKIIARLAPAQGEGPKP
ncbi:MAG: cell division protein FtsQ/DivIB [Deferrisomatales bacterium]